MSVITAGDLRKGTIFNYEGNVYTIVDFQHVKPGKGSAFVRVKMKNVKNGGNVERTFNPNEKLETAEIIKKTMSYIYEADGLYYFMDNETYEQIPLSADVIGDALKYIKENMECTISLYENEVFLVEPPTFVELRVEYTEPGFTGNTSTTAFKPAKLENGLEINVPLFINIDDVIRIDTRTGEYMERI